MADGIKVNASDWNNLSADDQTRISDLIASSFNGATITPDANEPSVGGAGALSATAAGGGIQALGICKMLCEIAKHSAALACKGFSGPALPICLAGVEAGYNFCIKKCK